ncbi:hypothetical protein N7577_07410 [Enterobacter roggenkampii]|uniref:hypothetical protein n=1 Tax=Enterobacter roggenkampii TaxID=1812935 RepID=UPI00244D23BF|nr:hypothetical protein [Enterobacter roggenkampii]MDG9878065.1 hypothetical protein [Enterobacter roggenkampii]
MEKIKNEVINYFEGLSQYETRSVLGDCADIFVYEKNDLEKYYNKNVFVFLKLVRVIKHKYSKEEFLKFIDNLIECEEDEMMKLIRHYVITGTRKLEQLQRNIDTFKKVLNRDTSNESVLSIL